MDIQKIISLVTETQGLIKNREMAAHVKEKGLADYVTQVDISVQDFFSEQRNKVNPYLLSAIQLLDDEEQIKLSEFICAVKKTN